MKKILEKIEVKEISESAIYLNVLASISLDAQQKIWLLAERCEKLNVQEIIPGMNNLTIIFDPINFQAKKLTNFLYENWEDINNLLISTTKKNKIIEIPVSYGGKFSSDLEDVAKYNNLSVKDVVKIHASKIYTVFFIGFMPGFAYLGGMDKKISTPRREDPRIVIPAGSVGIGGDQTGIYPKESPGGWNIIGNTKLKMFDYEKKQPSLLLPGNKLKFIIEEIVL